MSYVKNFDIGCINVEKDNCNFVYVLPLLTFGDVLWSQSLSLNIHSRDLLGTSSKIKCKTNLEKRIILTSGIPTEYEDGHGTRTRLVNFTDKYTFDDNSQRIIRKVSNEYILENPDGSKEYYLASGAIYKIKDKTDNDILTYSYSNYGIQIIYRIGKTISVNYQNGAISSIGFSAGSKSFNISLEYGSNLLKIHHFSKVDYIISYDNNEKEFTAYSTEVNAGYSKDYYQKLVCYIGLEDAVSTTRYIGKKPLDKANYTFFYDDNGEISKVLASHNNITTHIQYQDSKPIYSYEYPSSESAQSNDAFLGTVNMHNGEHVVGFQTYSDGIRMQRDPSNANVWSLGSNSPTTAGGTAIISGWINSKNNDESILLKIQTALVDSAEDSKYKYMFLPYAHFQQWLFFAAVVQTDNLSHIKVSFILPDDIYTDLQEDELSTRDVRVVLQNELISEEGNDHITVVEDILFDKAENTSISITKDLTFCNGSTPLDYETYKITANDVLKYIINNHLETNDNEIYYKNSKGIITSTLPLKVSYNNFTTNVTNFAVGKKWSISGKTYMVVTGYFPQSTGTCLTTKSYVNGTLYREEIYDDKRNLITLIEEGNTTYYSRNSKGLIYQKRLIDADGNVLTNSVEYDSLMTKVMFTTDEFGIKTYYETDNVTGAITKISFNDGTSTENVFDDGNRALIQKIFSDGSLSKQNQLDYTNGYLSSVVDMTGDSTQSNSYEFDNGLILLPNEEGTDIFEKISHFNNTIAEHVFHEHQTENFEEYFESVTSYYPSKSSTVYSIESKRNNYGKLTDVTNLIHNVWDISPEYSNGSYTVMGAEDSGGKLASSTDLVTGKTTKYAYENEKLQRTAVFDSSETKLSEESFTYDIIGRLTRANCVYDLNNGNVVGSTITYVKSENDPNADNRVYTYTYTVGGVRKSYTYNNYDSLKRLITKNTEMASGMRYTRSISYDKTRINQVSDSFSGANKGIDTYTYDTLGRIIGHSYSSANVASDNKTYVYDSFGRLIRENNQALDKTILYCYNNIGNITSVETFAYTTGNVTPGTGTIQNYTYDTTYPDRLKNFNGKGIVYNTLHCPTNYDGKSWTWTKGKLTRVRRGSANQPGSEYKDCTFTYDGYGRRINKHYIYDPNPAVAGDGNYYYDINYNYDESGRLIREFCTTHYDNMTESTREFVFLYDESGIIGTMYSLNGATAQPYYYRRNAQGDVIAIYDQYGSRKAEYAYDAFGNCTVLYAGLADLANYNPIRYRGYYYDKETNLYYLNSRYYNPEWRRFISHDSTEYIDPETPNGLNLYCYCGNDPVNYKDPSGHFAITTIAIISGVIFGFGISATSSIVTQLEENNGDWSKVNPLEVLYDGAFGAINGGLAASGIGIVSSAIFGGALGFVSSIGRDFLFEEDRNINWLGAVNSLFIGALAGLIAGAGANYVKDGMQVVKFGNSREILSRTIANGTQRAIERQTYALNVHAKQLLISGIRYMLSNIFSISYTMFTN